MSSTAALSPSPPLFRPGLSIATRRSTTWPEPQCAEQHYDLSVPKASSTLCNQAVFVDQATNSSLFLDAVLVEIDRFG